MTFVPPTLREATERRSPAERAELGRSAREHSPRSGHAHWAAPPGRPDPVTLLDEQNRGRLSWLVPVRHGRMLASPFAFYRGAARLMATDLATLPHTELEVQLGGDAHLSNFGTYASPERQLVFDANDFDETLPGPFEWDVKRLATSFTIAARHRGFDPEIERRVTARCVQAYRDAMTEFADMRVLDLWYDYLSIDMLSGLATKKRERKRLARFTRQARGRDNLQALRKLAVEVDGRYQIKSDPPLLFPLRELPQFSDPAAFARIVGEVFTAYRETLPDDRRSVLDRFAPVDVGLKVVGVGSVGTRCLVVLLEGHDLDDPLFLQLKEAEPSVLEEHLGRSEYGHPGQRVVEGQRLVQAASDIFLGWTTGPDGRAFYVRQLRDWKGSADIEIVDVVRLERYADLCGWTLARGHARSGDAVAIASYLGRGDTFDRAVSAFAAAYAQQNDADYRAFRAAVDDGRIAAEPGR